MQEVLVLPPVLTPSQINKLFLFGLWLPDRIDLNFQSPDMGVFVRPCFHPLPTSLIASILFKGRADSDKATNIPESKGNSSFLLSSHQHEMCCRTSKRRWCEEEYQLCGHRLEDFMASHKGMLR